jgi:hypothetical protein
MVPSVCTGTLSRGTVSMFLHWKLFIKQTSTHCIYEQNQSNSSRNRLVHRERTRNRIWHTTLSPPSDNITFWRISDNTIRGTAQWIIPDYKTEEKLQNVPNENSVISQRSIGFDDMMRLQSAITAVIQTSIFRVLCRNLKSSTTKFKIYVFSIRSFRFG